MEKKFRIISIIFILGCIIYYSGRFAYFYKKYNPKSSNGETMEVLGVTIQKQNGTSSSGDGLYNSNGNLVFKGSNVDNYLYYSNILWRVVRVNSDNSVVLTTDQIVSNLAWGDGVSSYKDSYINDWLNKSSEDNTGIFENKLNNKTKYLKRNTIYLDSIDSVKKITAKTKDTSSFVTLLSVSDYLNSKLDNSYINNSKNIWLLNSNSKNNVWNISDGSLTTSDSINGYGIKPVVTLNSNIGVVSGKGTKEKPYIIEEENKLSFGSYVKLGNDVYTVYEKNNIVTKLIANNLMNETNLIKFNSSNIFNLEDTSSLAYYLNNDFYNNLSYKKKLVDCDFYNGEYTNTYKYDYKNIYSSKVTTKVGLLNVADVNTNTSVSNYFMITPADNYKIHSYNNDENLYSSYVNYTKAIRPAICISSNTKLTGSGTAIDPFELEV